jgi:pseudaminic acid biosynthesis-associated methylase
MDELRAWEGDFGEAYTQRNVADWRVRQPAFREMIDGLPIQRVLEVGCNRGHNLVALADLLGAEAEVVAIEPNPVAREIARAASAKVAGYFDLAFTAGVLIHVPLEKLPAAIAQIYRVSRRYVLAIEYFDEQETNIPYHGRTDLLWKRNFLQHYQTQFPDLALVRQGYFGPESGFDRCHWWLMEKTAR